MAIPWMAENWAASADPPPGSAAEHVGPAASTDPPIRRQRAGHVVSAQLLRERPTQPSRLPDGKPGALVGADL